MKKILMLSIIFSAMMAVSVYAQMGMQGNQNQQQSDNATPGYGGHYPCPQMMGPGMMGQGMMGQGMMGPGMMGPGMMNGHGMMGGYGMGPGMMRGYGYGPGPYMGPGMMRGYGNGYGYGPGVGRGYTLQEYQQYMDETRDLREELHNKRFEYFEALRTPDTDPDTIVDLEKQIRDLQSQIYEKAPR